MSGPAGWWRTNRLWLPALPVAFALMVGASSYRVPDFLYRTGPNHELAGAGPGELVEVTDGFTDALGDTSRTVSVRLSGIEPVEEFPYDDAGGPRTPPDGLEAVRVTLDWEAEPDQVVRGCSVELKDDQGRRYGLIAESDQPGACVPEGAGGPEAPFSRDGERGVTPAYEEPRPATWSTEPVFLVPSGLDLTTVLIYWELPDHVALSVS